MMGKRRELAGLLTFCLVTAAILSVAGLWLRAQRKQFALNRQLITALKTFDTAGALTLVGEGADPNTRVIPAAPPSLAQLWRQLLHGAPLPGNDSATALAIACGGYWEDGYGSFLEDHRGHDDAVLAQLMLAHGADVNAKQEADGRR